MIFSANYKIRECFFKAQLSVEKTIVETSYEFLASNNEPNPKRPDGLWPTKVLLIASSSVGPVQEVVVNSTKCPLQTRDRNAFWVTVSDEITPQSIAESTPASETRMPDKFDSESETETASTPSPNVDNFCNQETTTELEEDSTQKKKRTGPDPEEGLVDAATERQVKDASQRIRLALLLSHHVPTTVKFTHYLWPEQNTSFCGVCVSGNCIVAICDPNGFQAVTFMPSERGLQARFRVRLEADRNLFSTLLSNGNLVQMERRGARHASTFLDSQRKSFNKFSFVAGPLVQDLCPHVTVSAINTSPTCSLLGRWKAYRYFDSSGQKL
eukprot:Gregarina_sp_Poly_1__11249@NODE_92_length_14764_cov_231_259032_g79_i0_p5_GENE_NODE_92_length_14764_cov_231_259032_g79_i0NODE_92_length_14764_cov_231_259032_g79_i0_p5_ORF_typecomplete_len327_score40_38Peptidase_M1_N/PF17900_1/0_0002DUF2490/PF10677_9/0_17_NODE_92_length_14764_cov_231_259032_g79_i078138793